jgi:hypothetical protein
LKSQQLRNGKRMTDTTNLVLLAKLDIRDALNHKLIIAFYFVRSALGLPPLKEGSADEKPSSLWSRNR